MCTHLLGLGCCCNDTVGAAYLIVCMLCCTASWQVVFCMCRWWTTLLELASEDGSAVHQDKRQEQPTAFLRVTRSHWLIPSGGYNSKVFGGRRFVSIVCKTIFSLCWQGVELLRLSVVPLPIGACKRAPRLLTAEKWRCTFLLSWESKPMRCNFRWRSDIAQNFREKCKSPVHENGVLCTKVSQWGQSCVHTEVCRKYTKVSGRAGLPFTSVETMIPFFKF